MRTLAFSSLAILVLAAGSFCSSLTKGSAPVSTTIPPYEGAYCSSLLNKTEICRVLVNNTGDSQFIVRQNQKVLNSIDAPSWGTAANNPDSFLTYKGDLDGNGSSELVLVSHEGVSQGMGVTYSTVHIFRDPKAFPNAKPASIPIQEFGDNETFRFDRKLKRTLILATYWNEYKTLDTRRGWGLYLVGKWFRYQRGGLEPVLGRPIRARRFLNSFANERDNGWFENRHPLRWLQDRRTHLLYREPEVPDHLETTTSGVIKEVTNDPEFGCTLTILTDDGKNISSQCPFDVGPIKPWNGTTPITHTGLWRQRYLFPKSFDPIFFFDQIVGRPVRLETYKTEFDNRYSLLWFTE